MTTTVGSSNGSRTLSIQNAVVTINAVRVDGKPMTISVYSQIPQREYRSEHADRIIGLVRRCPSRCQAAVDWEHPGFRGEPGKVAHRHLLATLPDRDGPVLLWTPTDGGWKFRQYMSLDATDEQKAQNDLNRDAAAGFRRWLESLPQVYVAA